MECCRPSRRQALLWGSLAAATPLVAGAAASPASAATPAATTPSSSSDILVTDLEVATVTDTSVVITWFTGSASQVDQYGFPEPLATDTELQLGQFDVSTLSVVPGTLKTVLQDDTQTPYHYAEVHGLEPGTAYAYAALSNGQTAQQSSMQFPVGVGGSLDYPGAFETLTTPPGRYLFTLALGNDLHMGEGESGIIENNWPPAFEQDPGLPAYPVVMLEAMLGDLRQPDRGADRLLVAGDLTSSALQSQAAQVKQMLDGWGQIERDYFVTRGNHDRSMVGSDYATCTAVPNTSPQHYDCWGGSATTRSPTSRRRPPRPGRRSTSTGRPRSRCRSSTRKPPACSSTTPATPTATSGRSCSTTPSRRSSRSSSSRSARPRNTRAATPWCGCTPAATW